jgi:trimethylamine:corrinoid methyltransferase-like protein
MLRGYEPPLMDEAVDEALRAYIARREEELPEGVE